MDTEKITDLLDRYLDGTASPAEAAIVEAWYRYRAAGGSGEGPAGLGEAPAASIDGPAALGEVPATSIEGPAALGEAPATLVGKQLKARIDQKISQRSRLPVRWLAAASILIFAALILLLQRRAATPGTALAPPALLTSLESSRLIHTNTGAWRTLSTPPGGQYRVSLPDGSVVWLNCASSLRYPVIFGANERRVELSGEAWFDIANNAAKPFIVVSGGVKTVVLGTRFDIMAYPDEPVMRTTLLSGSVSSGSVRLDKPGQQAIGGAQGMRITEADTTTSTAWKSGRFEFDEQPMPVIMRQVQRWYTVSVDYAAGADTIALSGSIARRQSVKGLLDLLSQTSKVHFDIDGQHILVRP